MGTTIIVGKDGKVAKVNEKGQVEVSIADAQLEVGNVSIQELKVAQHYEGSGDATIPTNGTMKALTIINDSESELRITVGDITIPVKAAEGFGDTFADFTSVSVTATGPYRIVFKN